MEPSQNEEVLDAGVAARCDRHGGDFAILIDYQSTNRGSEHDQAPKNMFLFLVAKKYRKNKTSSQPHHLY